MSYRFRVLKIPPEFKNYLPMPIPFKSTEHFWLVLSVKKYSIKRSNKKKIKKNNELIIILIN